MDEMIPMTPDSPPINIPIQLKIDNAITKTIAIENVLKQNSDVLIEIINNLLPNIKILF